MAQTSTLAALAALGSLAFGPLAIASAQPGQPLPAFTAVDLTGQSHNSSELHGRRTMVVAIASRGSSAQMRDWWAAADRAIPREVHRTSLLALDLSPIVTGGLARSVARGEVPQAFWHDTWLDKSGRLARTLGLASAPGAEVFALDEQGHVVAHAHGAVSSANARAIWSALAR